MTVRVLLINSNTEVNPNPVLPMGMAYVASALSLYGFKVSCADLCFKKDWKKFLGQKIREFLPEYIGISIRNIDNHDHSNPNFYLDGVSQIIAHCRAISRAKLFCGGAALSVMPEKILKYLGLEAGIFGDGEEVTPRLIAKWQRHENIADLPGLVYLRNGRAHCNPHQGIELLDKAPYHELPRWIDPKPYFSQEASYPIQAKRGCPFDCIYCTYATGEGKRYRFRSAEKVAQEVVQVYEKYRPKSIEFVDSIFNHPAGFAESICQELIRQKSRAKLHTIELNPGFITAELVGLMEKAGFISCGITCESASDKILKNLYKSYDAQQVRAAARNLKNSKMKKLWVFLMGGPGEDEDTVEETLHFVREELGDNDVVFFNIGIRVYPGTKIETIARQEGLINAQTNLLYPAFYLSPKITRDKIEQMIKDEKNDRIVTIKDLRLPYLSTLLKAASLISLKGPYWSYAPIFNKIRSLLCLK